MKKFTFKAKLLAAMVLLNVITICTYTAYFYYSNVQKDLDEVDSFLETSALSMPKILENQLSRIFERGSDAYSEEAFEAEVRKFAKYTESIGLEYLYAVTVKDGKVSNAGI